MITPINIKRSDIEGAYKALCDQEEAFFAQCQILRRASVFGMNYVACIEGPTGVRVMLTFSGLPKDPDEARFTRLKPTSCGVTFDPPTATTEEMAKMAKCRDAFQAWMRNERADPLPSEEPWLLPVPAAE